MAAADVGNGQVVAWNTVSSLSDVATVAMSAGHGVAIKRDGAFAEWGYLDGLQDAIPAPSDVSDFRAIAPGFTHTVALKSDGTVVAWGQTGPQSVVPAGLGQVIAVDADEGYSMAVTSDGRVVAWGDNWGGQRIPPADLRGVTAVSGAFSHALALKSDGTVVGWGSNYYGQTTPPAGLNSVIAIDSGKFFSLALKSDGRVVGWGTNTEHQIAIPAGLTGVTAIAAGYDHSLALKSDGTVVAWGDNSNGETKVPAGLSGVVSIAAGSSQSVAVRSDGTVVAWGYTGNGQANVPPAAASGIVSVAAGESHSLAVRKDGTVLAWGNNEQGQASVPAGVSGVVQVSAGTYHSLALKRDGTVVAWGWGALVTRIPSGLSGITAISAGTMHNLALKKDGTVVAWGGNAYHALDVPAGLTGVVAIAAGGTHSLALKSDGTVVAWGARYDGHPPIAHGVVPPGLSGVVAIAAGYEHSVVVKGDGTVVAWGFNQYGEADVPSGLSGVVAVDSGWRHTLALKADGTVVAWGGFNGHGQRDIPVGLSGVTAISAGGYHSMAIIGDGDPRLAPTPVPVINHSNPTVDMKLTAQTGLWGPAPVNLSYQWYRISSGGTSSVIVDATAATYTVRAADKGYRLKVKVTGAKTDYPSVSTTSAATAPVASASFVTAPQPAITVDGTPRVGKTASVIVGDYSPTATKYAFQWYRGTSAIDNATKTTYTFTSSDQGKSIKVRVKAYRSGYVTRSQYSKPTTPIQPRMPTPATPRLSDTTPRVDQRVSVTNTPCPAVATSAPRYQWFKGSTPITGATNSSYTPRAADLGSTIRVKIFCSDPDYVTRTRSSANTDEVARAFFSVKGIATVQGLPLVGQPLTADEGTWTPVPDALTYRWLRNGTAITGGTEHTLTPTTPGTYTVKITARKLGYSSTTITSSGIVVTAP